MSRRPVDIDMGCVHQNLSQRHLIDYVFLKYYQRTIAGVEGRAFARM